MIFSNESHKTIIQNDYLVVLPEIKINKNYEEKYGNNYRIADEEYSSGNNDLIGDEDLIKMIVL